MTKRAKTVIIILSTIALIIVGGLYFLRSFLGAFALPKVTVSKDFILTSQDFVNGVTIEKIHVDSIGKEGYPLKYTTYYTTSCNIHHPSNKPPNPPSKIEFYKPVNIRGTRTQ
jgi:hypothetical protein